MDKKERDGYLQKDWFWIGIIILAILIFVGYIQLTGNVINEGFGGPSVEESECLHQCVVSEKNSEEMCMNRCGVEPKPEAADEGEGCMQECIIIGCSEYDIECQNNNLEKCEEKCEMRGDAPDESEMSEEQLCISNCVAKEDPSAICGNSQEGETGNAVCQRCAGECAYLYEGPCLNDEEITAKEAECQTCEHCYGEIIEGPSGQGWDCIIDVVCADASSEFGDDAGTGPGIGQEGFIAKTGETIGNVFEGIGNFFSGIFNK